MAGDPLDRTEEGILAGVGVREVRPLKGFRGIRSRLTGLPGCRDGSESARDRGSGYPRWPLEVPTPLPCYSESRASKAGPGLNRSTPLLTSISIFAARASQPSERI